MAIWLSLMLAGAVGAGPWAEPEPPLGAERFGAGIQRTMTLLATSTPEHRNTVRVLFYGQSITEQPWTKEVARWLRATYPNANLIIENRAIGGFASQLLVKTAESDLYPFEPDLVIFYVYGSHIEYENIIRRIRERTTAEILMQTDHCTVEADLTEETDPARLSPKQWSAWMNHCFLPATARKYGAELCDQRAEWKRYLTAQKLAPRDLLIDGVHLNDRGCFLMAELVKPHLRYLPGEPTTAWQSLTRTVSVGQDARFEQGRLRLEFDGSRVDLIARPGAAPAGSLSYTIDGQPPPAIRGLYAATRASAYPGLPWPVVMRVGWTQVPVPETWTVRLIEPSDDLKSFRFAVTGSVTGADGEGSSAERFVSRSGRVVIEPDDWSLARSREFTKKPLGDAPLTWTIVPRFVDRWRAPANQDPTLEPATTLFSGLKNGHHTLELIADGDVSGLAAIRIHRPPFGDSER